MLIALQVQGLAVIESAEIKLEPGLNVLSGETGAGKSIVVGAVQLALGGRARSDIVRPGVKQAEVEALFDISQDSILREQLRSSGIHCDGELVVRRIVSDSGRSRAYLNGRLCAVSELAALAPRLADVTSQHASVALTDSAEQLRYLDQYADATQQRRMIASTIERVRQLDGQLAQLRAKERERREREAFLRYQLEGIDSVDPQPDELDELHRERSRLRHANELSQLTATVAERLSRDQGVCDQVARATADLLHASELDSGLRELAVELESCFAQLQDVARSITDYARGAEADPIRLEEVNERLFQLEGLLRQHGPELSDVLVTRARIDGELQELDQLTTTLPTLLKTRAGVLTTAIEQSNALSRKRRRAAKRLARQAQEYLRELGMPTARVEVKVSPRRNGPIEYGGTRKAGSKKSRPRMFLGCDGGDQIELLVSTNRGMEPRPLSRIASGGELSRVLLAMKRALGMTEHALGSEPTPRSEPAPGLAAAAEQAPHSRPRPASSSGEWLRVTPVCGVQVFDEVDAGIGGATADKVGRAMAAIAPRRQVLCITHLAAIAAFADAHFVVEKHEGAKTAATLIRRVRGKARVAELARMLTGKQTAKTSLRAARALLAAAAA